MIYRTRTYIAADWTGDKDAVNNNLPIIVLYNSNKVNKSKCIDLVVNVAKVHVAMKDNYNKSSISFEFSDLFCEECFVITTNRYFDVNPTGDYIAKDSLLGKFVLKFFSNNLTVRYSWHIYKEIIKPSMNLLEIYLLPRQDYSYAIRKKIKKR